MKKPCRKTIVYCFSESRESVPIFIIHLTMHYSHKKAKGFFFKNSRQEDYYLVKERMGE